MLRAIQFFIWLFVNNGIMMMNIHLNLTPKFQKWYIKYGVPFVFLWYFYIGLLIAPYNSFVRYSGTVFFFFYSLYFFKDKILTKLYISLVTLVIATGVEVIIHLFSTLTEQQFVNPHIVSVENLAYITAYNFVLFVIYSIFSYIHNKRHERILNKSMFYFILVPLSQFFICEGVCFKAFTDLDGYKEFVNQELLFIGLIIACVADVLLFTAIRTNNKAELNKRKIAQLEYNQALALNYYEGIKKNAETLMKYKHDFNNMLSTAYQLIQSNDEKSKSDGIKLLNQIRDKNKATVIPVYSENSVVNAILFDKTNYAEEHGVVIDCETKVPSEISIELTDLCSIISNLLDNAIKSAEKSHNNKVELNAWCDMGYLFVRARNFPDDVTELKTNKNHLDKSIKADAHGYGMDILSDIAEKYDGKMDFDYDDNVVSAVCSVKVE